MKAYVLIIFNTLDKIQKYSVFGIIGIIIIMIMGVTVGIWDLINDIVSQIPAIILLPSILALFLFAFAGKILAKLKRQIGDADSFGKGIQHYNSRNGIPFQKVLDKVIDTVDMSALTFTVIRYSNLSLIEQKLKKGIKFTFILPDINSKIIDRHRDRYPSSNDLKEQIEKSLAELCNLKKKFKDNLTIKINNIDNFDNSIILVDKNKHEKAFIKVESRPIGKSANERASDLIIMKDNEKDYYEWKSLYEDILDNSKDYVC